MSVDVIVNRLRNEVISPLKRRFVGRDEVVDLIALAIVAGEHLFLLGPPGTAKSAIIRQFANSVQSRYFECLLTRFSEPTEVFGPIDLNQLREGKVATVTQGMLPEAEFALLDELFNANSAILNNLLNVLNERVFKRGAETHHLPLLSMFSASNKLPEEAELKALFDRFLLRCYVGNLPRESIAALLAAGRQLEYYSPPLVSTITAEDLRELSRQIAEVDLSVILSRYTDLIGRIRDLGIEFSDRRAVKALKLIAASALLSGRSIAHVSDLWVMRYVWDREEQIAPLKGLIVKVMAEASPTVQEHPLARTGQVDAESLATWVAELENQAAGERMTMASIAQMRESVAAISDQAAWLADDSLRKQILDRLGPISKRIG